MSNRIHRTAFALTLALASNCAVPAAGLAQPQADETLVAAIDKVIEKQGFHADEPGVTVLIRQPGRFLFQKGYGLANLKSRKPITPQTVFELASVSKTFTATAVLILHDQGKLSIEDDVRKHIPELPEYHKTHPIRVRDLLLPLPLSRSHDRDPEQPRHVRYRQGLDRARRSRGAAVVGQVVEVRNCGGLKSTSAGRSTAARGRVQYAGSAEVSSSGAPERSI